MIRVPGRRAFTPRAIASEAGSCASNVAENPMMSASASSAASTHAAMHASARAMSSITELRSARVSMRSAHGNIPPHSHSWR